MSTEAKLIACPFCGENKAELSDNGDKFNHTDTYFVKCHACGAQGPFVYDGSNDMLPGNKTLEECNNTASEAWNKRWFVCDVHETDQAALVAEALELCCWKNSVNGITGGVLAFLDELKHLGLQIAAIP